MADLALLTPGSTLRPDPALVLAEGRSPVEFETEVALRMAPWRRQRLLFAFEGSDREAGRHWLAATFATIVAGRQPDAQLPARIEITLPASDLAGLGFRIRQVVVPRLDGIEPRVDVLDHLQDPRAIILLCAPEAEELPPALRNVLQYASEAGIDPVRADRTALLDTRTRRSGPALKEGAGLLALPVLAFDGSEEVRRELANLVSRRIKLLRARQKEEVRLALGIAHSLADGSTVTEGALLGTALRPVLNRMRDPGRWISNPQDALLRLARSSSWRLLADSVRAMGRLAELDFAACLTGEVVRQAAQCSFGLMRDLRRIAAQDFGEQGAFLRGIVPVWERDFLLAVRLRVITSFRARLDHDWPFRDKDGLAVEDMVCRQALLAQLEGWFSRNADFGVAMEDAISLLWRKTVLMPLEEGFLGEPAAFNGACLSA
ncbi:hypothetical protein [Roseomonas sp. SXEYE001]